MILKRFKFIMKFKPIYAFRCNYLPDFEYKGPFDYELNTMTYNFYDECAYCRYRGNKTDIRIDYKKREIYLDYHNKRSCSKFMPEI